MLKCKHAQAQLKMHVCTCSSRGVHMVNWSVYMLNLSVHKLYWRCAYAQLWCEHAHGNHESCFRNVPHLILGSREVLFYKLALLAITCEFARILALFGSLAETQSLRTQKKNNVYISIHIFKWYMPNKNYNLFVICQFLWVTVLLLLKRFQSKMCFR